MFEKLEELRQKPESYRNKVAFFTSFSVVLVIFVVWLTVIYPDFKKVNPDSVAETDTPTDNFANAFTESVSTIGDEIAKLKTLTSFLTSSTTTYYNATNTPKNE